MVFFLSSTTEIIQCGHLPQLFYSQWNDSECETDDIIFPRACKVICDNGFSLFGEADTVVCGDDGIFKPSKIPQCLGLYWYSCLL